ncbi:MAG: ABC transporter ATP-binding protein [Clostridia bacterium]
MIKIKNYTKKINNDLILNNINYDFENGKIYGIVGKNGSGKTMLLKAIAGFLKPTNGMILVNDQDIYKESIFPKDTGILIGNQEYLPNLTGMENLINLAKINNTIKKEDILKYIEIFNMEEDINKLFRKYSMGMKQKIGIIQSVMENQSIILLDEPFNGVDNASVLKIKEFLNSIKKEKIIIISTHYKDDINKFCDTIIELNNGEII